MMEAYTTLEEKNLFQRVIEALPEYFYIKKNNKNNCYIYNEVDFYDITAQQLNNEYNLSVGLIQASIIASGQQQEVKEEDVRYYTHTTNVKKTFEFHVWSVNKSNIETLNMAELVRQCILSLPLCINVQKEINLYYRTLDNTTKAMSDCVFTADLLSVDVYKEKVEDQDFNELVLDKVVFLGEK